MPSGVSSPHPVGPPTLWPGAPLCRGSPSSVRLPVPGGPSSGEEAANERRQLGGSSRQPAALGNFLKGNF